MRNGVRSLARVVLSSRPRLAVEVDKAKEALARAEPIKSTSTKHAAVQHGKGDDSGRILPTTITSRNPHSRCINDLSYRLVPYQNASTSLADPFARFDTLHAHSNSTMAQLLASVSPANPTFTLTWTAERLLSILSRESDLESLKALVDPIQHALSQMSHEQSGQIVGSFVYQLGKWEMIHEMRTLLKRFHICMTDSAKTDLNLTCESLQMAYWYVFNGLTGFKKRPIQFSQSERLWNLRNDERGTRTFDGIIDDEVWKTASHMLKMLERSPRRVEGDRKLRTFMLDRLFSPRFLTPRLRRLLIDSDAKGWCAVDWQMMKERHWHWCWVTAVLAGDEYAGFYMKKKNQARHKRLKGDVETSAVSSTFELQGTPGAGAGDGEEMASERKYWDVSDATDGLDGTEDSLAHEDEEPAFGLQISTRALSRHVETIEATATESVPRRYEDNVYFPNDDFPYKDTDTLSPTMWTTIFANIDRDDTVKAIDINRLIRSLPNHSIEARVLAPAMQGLLRRNQPTLVWDIWLDLLRLESRLPLSKRGLYVDVYVLGLATQACGALRGVEAAVRLVDGFAQRPGRRSQDDMIETIQINQVIVNQLLSLCRKEKTPSIAFRIWGAAQSRWGVRPDHISLAIIQDIARRAEMSFISPDENVHQRSRNDTPSPTFFRERWQNLMEEIWGRRRNADEEAIDEKYNAYNADGFSKGGSGVLLDPPNYTWFGENGTVRPWQRAKSLFRAILYTNWPDIRALKSPLELDSGSPFFSQLLTQKGKLVLSDTSPTSTTPPPPDPDGRWSNVKPDSAAFMAHIKLLGFFQQASEIPLVFAQMKYLKVIPSWPCMLQGLMYIAEVEGQPRLVDTSSDGGVGRQEGEILRDEEIMRRWLMRWLGEGDEVVNMGKRYTPEGIHVWKEGVEVRDGAAVVDQFMVDERKEKVVRRLIVPSKDDVWNYRQRLAYAGKKLMQD